MRRNGTIGLWFACEGPFLGALLPWGLGAGPLRGGAAVLPPRRGASLILLVLRGMILEYWRFEVRDWRIYARVKTAGPARPIKDPNYYLAFSIQHSDLILIFFSYTEGKAIICYLVNGEMEIRQLNKAWWCANVGKF